MIGVGDEGGVRVLTLDRAERRNALTPEMLGALNGAIRASAGVRAVALVGAGAVFCAGFDLKMCAADATGATLRSLLSGLSEAIRGLRALGAPVVVGAHGAAIAGGAALLGGGDVVVSEAGAKIGYPVARIGVSPAVSAAFLRESVGGRVRGRLLDPELIDGRRAHEIGLVHELAADGASVRARAIEIAGALGEKPGRGVAATKRWLDEIAASETALGADAAGASLEASLSIVGNDEERARLEAMWGETKKGDGDG